MTETKHGVDASFNDRLNILRAGVLGANDGHYLNRWSRYQGLPVRPVIFGLSSSLDSLPFWPGCLLYGGW